MKLIGSGCECKVYEIDQLLVLKAYKDKSVRDNAFNRQKKAFTLGIAPAVVRRKAKIIDFNKYYCYISERADRPNTYTIYDSNKKRINDIKNIMKLMGLEIFDVTYNNLGICNDIIVCVDFGDMSVGKS